MGLVADLRKRDLRFLRVLTRKRIWSACVSTLVVVLSGFLALTSQGFVLADESAEKVDTAKRYLYQSTKRVRNRYSVWHNEKEGGLGFVHMEVKAVVSNVGANDYHFVRTKADGFFISVPIRDHEAMEWTLQDCVFKVVDELDAKPLDSPRIVQVFCPNSDVVQKYVYTPRNGIISFEFEFDGERETYVLLNRRCGFGADLQECKE